MTHRTLLTLIASAGAVFASTDARPDDRRFESTRQLLQHHVDARKIAGAVAVVAERDRIVFRAETGWQDADAKRPIRRDTLFRIASMTKPVTSVAVMMLVEEGRVKLTDPLEKFIPEFASPSVVSPTDGTPERPKPAERSITIHDLLTHTSGLTYGSMAQPQGRLYDEAGISEGLLESDLSLAESTRRLGKLPLVQQPGSDWQYGLSTDVLGRVVEAASGKSFDDFVQQQILKPLQMNDTQFVVPQDKLSRLSDLYRPASDGTIEAVGDGVQRLGGFDYSATFQHPGRTEYRSGGAGLVSTADDYLRFLQMLLNGGTFDGRRLLKEETVRQMTSNQIGELSIAYLIHGDKFGYGFGVHSIASDQLNGASPGTCSWGGIFHTYFWVDPKREVAGVLMTQLFPFNHMTLWGDFQREVYKALETTIDVGRAPGPQPGDVYREFALHNGGNLDWRVTDPRATADGAWKFLPNPELSIELADLEHATRAEAIIDRWGGHLRTTDKRIRFNRHPWLRIPELETTPEGRAEYFYSQDNPVIPVPLAHLRDGVNTVEGTCSTRDGYNWGQWGLYSLIVRVYYDQTAVSGDAVNITAPSAGAIIVENPLVEVHAPADARRVEVLAYYDGDDEDGDGRFEDWHGAHHQPARGAPAALSGHVGTDDSSPFAIRWDTIWVPDQQPEAIRLLARVQLRDGRWKVSPPIERLTLQRTDQHVAIVRSTDVPEGFGVRAGRTAFCTLNIPKVIPLESIRDARLSLRTWHGWDGHHHPLRWNGLELPIEGNNHHYDSDRLSIPPSSLKTGPNIFEIRSDTDHHMLEVLWPSPTLLLRHDS